MRIGIIGAGQIGEGHQAELIGAFQPGRFDALLNEHRPAGDDHRRRRPDAVEEVGPVRLDFGYNLNPPEYQTVGALKKGGPQVIQNAALPHFNFYFSVGQTF